MILIQNDLYCQKFIQIEKQSFDFTVVLTQTENIYDVTLSVSDSERNMGPWTEFEESSVPESPFLGPVLESADVFSEFEEHDCQGDECSRTKSTTEEAYYTTKEAKPSSTTEGPDGKSNPSDTVLYNK